MIKPTRLAQKSHLGSVLNCSHHCSFSIACSFQVQCLFRVTDGRRLPLTYAIRPIPPFLPHSWRQLLPGVDDDESRQIIMGFIEEEVTKAEQPGEPEEPEVMAVAEGETGN